MYKRQHDEGLVGIWKLSFDKPMPLDINNHGKIKDGAHCKFSCRVTQIILD